MRTAQPWRHPETGVFYLRRQIPKRIRHAFNGSALWKESLHTKDPAEAARRFTIANNKLQARFDEAERATGRLSPEDAERLVSAYFSGKDRPENPRAEFRSGWALFDIHYNRDHEGSTPTGDNAETTGFNSGAGDPFRHAAPAACANRRSSAPHARDGATRSAAENGLG